MRTSVFLLAVLLLLFATPGVSSVFLACAEDEGGGSDFIGPPAPDDSGSGSSGSSDFVGPPAPDNTGTGGTAGNTSGGTSGSGSTTKPKTKEELEKERRDKEKDAAALRSFGGYLGNAAGGVAGSYINSLQRQAAATPRSNLSRYRGQVRGGPRLQHLQGVDSGHTNTAISQSQRQFDPFTVAEFNEATNEQAELANRIVAENQVNAQAIEARMAAETQRDKQISGAISGLMGGGGLSGFVSQGVSGLFSGVFNSFAGGGKTGTGAGTSTGTGTGTGTNAEPTRPGGSAVTESTLTNGSATNNSGADSLSGGTSSEFVGPPAPENSGSGNSGSSEFVGPPAPENSGSGDSGSSEFVGPPAPDNSGTSGSSGE